MNNFLWNVLYYAIPAVACVYAAVRLNKWFNAYCKKIDPKLGNDLKHGRINVVFILIMIAACGLIFLLNSFVWATASFFALRG